MCGGWGHFFLFLYKQLGRICDERNNFFFCFPPDSHSKRYFYLSPTSSSTDAFCSLKTVELSLPLLLLPSCLFLLWFQKRPSLLLAENLLRKTNRTSALVFYSALLKRLHCPFIPWLNYKGAQRPVYCYCIDLIYSICFGLREGNWM